MSGKLGGDKIVLIVSAIITLTIMFVASLIVRAATVQVIDVKAGDEYVLALNLNNNDIVNGTITVSSIGRNIYFYIADPQGTKIIDYGLVTVDTSFQFTANSNGAHTLHFDNRFSSPRTITISYSTYTNASDMDWTIYLVVALVVIIVLLITVLLYYESRKRQCWVCARTDDFMNSG